MHPHFRPAFLALAARAEMVVFSLPLAETFPSSSTYSAIVHALSGSEKMNHR